MSAAGDGVLAWVRAGDELRCRVEVASQWTRTAQGYALHRLRQVRARPFGFLHPSDVRLHDGQLVLSFPRGALDGRTPRPRQFPVWLERFLLPLIETLVLCHEQGIAGLASPGIVGGRWIPPVEWFLPATAGHRSIPDTAAIRATSAWIDAEDRKGPGVASFVEALRHADLPRLDRLVQESRPQVAARLDDRVPPSLLMLLTEAELLERVSTVYRYRILRSAEVRAMGLDVRAQTVLEVDRGWADPHFPKLTRPSPQEVWDSLVEESRVTPILAASGRMPNALDSKLDESDDFIARWIGVHEDQPLLYLQHDPELPPRGFIRLHLVGDNKLMERKRAFTAFAGTHPALLPWLDAPPSAQPFQDNPQPRADLEEAILRTHGVFAVQGPPGTGKTHLATEVVRRFLARTPAGRVLVCAKEHFALDHILLKITRAIGEDGCLFRAWRSVSLAKQRRSRGEVHGQWLPDKVTRELGARDWAAWASGWTWWQAATSDQHDQRLAALGQQSANLFFATTMDSAMVDFIATESFDLVIIEEAGKCYPSELLHALCFGRTTLMIGDQRQLPPYQERRTREAIHAWQQTLERARRDPEHREQMAARFGDLFGALEALLHARGPLGETEQAWLRPFEFLFDRLPTRHRLEEQFRMEAPLSRAVGTVFYGRPFIHRKQTLVDTGRLPARPLGDVLPPDLDVAMLWLDTPHMTEDPDATEDTAKRGVRDNQRELEVVRGYLRRLRPGPPIDLVLLTPYNAQKRLLLDDQELRTLCERLTTTPFDQVVRTTDEYQGREAELTVLSLVRNNSLGARAWGFMTEPERLNVMFSRTRFRQVVVGSGAHIERHAQECPWLHQFWRAYQTEAKDPTCARILPAREVLGG